MEKLFTALNQEITWKDRLRNRITKWLLQDKFIARVPDRPIQKDTTQFGILCEGTLTPELFERQVSITFTKNDETATITTPESRTGSVIKSRNESGWEVITQSYINKQLPMITGSSRVYQSFKPRKIIATELVCSTYGGLGLPDITLYEYLEHADDAVMLQAYLGNYNCFPNAPDQRCGIAASSLVDAEIDWPTLNPGIDANIGFAIEPSILTRARGSLAFSFPKIDGALEYDPSPKLIEVKVRVNIFGPTLR